MANVKADGGAASRGARLETVREMSNVLPIPRLQLAVEKEAGRAAARTVVLEGDVIRIGSHESNDVVLDDPLVSRFHCSITRGETSWSISDSGSMNGTSVNGVRVRDADLPLPTCSVGLGRSVVTVSDVGPAGITEIPTWSSFGELYGESREMRRLFGILSKVAESEATVLVEGDSGTGKELAATEIARRGPRADRPFIIVDCSSIAPNLIESELFGHAKGAFTGADRERVGAFEAASGGTIFLDEIGEMPLDMQPKLLRALEAREIRRMGENLGHKIDVRVIAATNRRLEAEVNRNRFREDLFFRLSVVRVRIPPLRRRLDDLPILVGVLLRSLGAEDSEHLFTPEVFEDLRKHDWPGNVRELRNYVERTVVLESADPAEGRYSQLPAGPETRASRSSTLPVAVDLEVPFKVAKDQIISSFERQYLTALLDSAGGNISRAARQARMDRMYLYRLLQKHGLRGGSIKD